METLIINIPEERSTLIKQILKYLGATIQQAGKISTSGYKEKLAKISTWSDEDLKTIKI